jgi:hypothetical protein
MKPFSGCSFARRTGVPKRLQPKEAESSGLHHTAVNPPGSVSVFSAFASVYVSSASLPSGKGFWTLFFHMLQGSLYVSIAHEKVGTQDSSRYSLSCLAAFVLLIIEISVNRRHDGHSG